MKTMTCKQLGGSCDMEFHAETFKKMTEMSRNHGMKMFKQGDLKHLRAMNKMKELKKEPEMLKKWMDKRKKIFDNLPEDE